MKVTIYETKGNGRFINLDDIALVASVKPTIDSLYKCLLILRQVNLPKGKLTDYEISVKVKEAGG